MEGYRVRIVLGVCLLITLCSINNTHLLLLQSAFSSNTIRNDTINADVSPSSSRLLLPPLNERDVALWNRTYGGTAFDQALSLIEVSTGGFLFVGSTTSSGAGLGDAWLVRLDADGSHLWNHTYGGIDDEAGVHLIECSDGGFAFTGETEVNRFWLVRTDADGNHLWNQTFVETMCGSHDLVECSDGGFALAVSTKEIDPDFDIGLFRTDANGNLLWSKVFPDTGLAKRILPVGTGFLLVGDIYNDEIGHDCFVVRTDENGNMLWNQTYGGIIEINAEWAIPVSSGGFLIAGSLAGASWSNIWLIRIDDVGEVLWNGMYHPSSAIITIANEIVECSDGGFAIAGLTAISPYWDTFDGFLLRVDQHGNQLWTQTYGDPNEYDGLSGIIIASSGYLMCVGYTEGYGVTGGDAWMLCIPAPRWVEEPTNYYSELGTLLTYDLNATAPDGIDQWWLNDTSNLSIDTEGIIQNTSTLALGTYPLCVSVNDTHGHSINASLTINIVPVAPPVWHDTPPTNRLLELNTHLYYDLDATDISGLDTWWLNDTIRFSVDNQGVIRNATTLMLGQYGLQVWVNDTLGEILTSSFTVIVQDTTPPSWVEHPENQNLEYGQPFAYQLSATDFGGLDTWWINDTSHFTISNNGLITNIIPLPVGIYGLQVWVNDTSANTLTAIFTINVQGSTTPLPGIPGFPMIAIVVGLIIGVSLGIIVRHKRRIIP